MFWIIVFFLIGFEGYFGRKLSVGLVVGFGWRLGFYSLGLDSGLGISFLFRRGFGWVVVFGVRELGRVGGFVNLCFDFRVVGSLFVF